MRRAIVSTKGVVTRPTDDASLVEAMKATEKVLWLDLQSPSPEDVNKIDAELTRLGKVYEFHRYDGAGHGIFYWHRPLYRPEQTMDGWSKVFAFFGKHLAK